MLGWNWDLRLNLLCASSGACWSSCSIRRRIRPPVADGSQMQRQSVRPLNQQLSHDRQFRNTGEHTHTGPPGSIRVCPLPSMLGDAEYDLTMFSWSIVTGPPAYGENGMLLMTSRDRRDQIAVLRTSHTFDAMTRCIGNSKSEGSLPRVLFMIFAVSSRMSVRHSTPSYPPLALTAGSSAMKCLFDAESIGARTHESVRTADWCARI